MKKVVKPYRKTYPRLLLFKDDIEKLMTLFKEHLERSDVILDSYRLENKADLDQCKGKQATELNLTGRDSTLSLDSYISLDLTKDTARLYVANEDDIGLRGIGASIDDLLWSRRRRVATFISHWWVLALFLMIGIPIVFLINQFTPYLKGIQAYCALGALWILIPIRNMWMFYGDKHVIIMLVDSSDSSHNLVNILRDPLWQFIGAVLTLLSFIIALIALFGTK